MDAKSKKSPPAWGQPRVMRMRSAAQLLRHVADASQSDREGLPAWWVIGFAHECCDPMGPYDTKADAEAGRVGVERFYRNNAWLFKPKPNPPKKAAGGLARNQSRLIFDDEAVA